MRRLKNWQNFDNLSVFFNKIGRFIAQYVNFVEQHAKIPLERSS